MHTFVKVIKIAFAALRKAFVLGRKSREKLR